MPFTSPTAERRFVLDTLAGLPELAATDRFAVASADVVDAVLDGIGDFAAGEWAPLARLGDTTGATWTHDGVKMPEGSGWHTRSARLASPHQSHFQNVPQEHQRKPL
jgi:3-(methylthio)propanoyl-CoA dehydrogenase